MDGAAVTTKSHIVKVTERGWVGHFICGSRCRFRRNTLLERGQTRIVVSSVGLMETKDRSGAYHFEQIGCDRYYETMAFRAIKEGVYWEADVGRQINFDAPWSLNECGQDSDQKFNDMHDAVVLELRLKLAEGRRL